MTRSRTPPALKFLLNERAAAEGELAAACAACDRAAAAVTAAQAALDAAQRRASHLEELRDSVRNTIAALDITAETMYPGVNPCAAGTVNAWAGNYGKRGAFKAFLHDCVRAAAPAAVSTQELTAAVIARFGLTPESARERQRLATMVRRCILKAAAAGRVERMPTETYSSPGLWRWKTVSGSDLLALTAAPDDAQQNFPGAEVAGQRVGRRHG